MYYVKVKKVKTINNDGAFGIFVILSAGYQYSICDIEILYHHFTHIPNFDTLYNRQEIFLIVFLFGNACYSDLLLSVHFVDSLLYLSVFPFGVWA